MNRYKLILINNTNKTPFDQRAKNFTNHVSFLPSFIRLCYLKYENDCRHNITCICIPYYMHQCITDFRFMIQTENYLSNSVIQIFTFINFFELFNWGMNPELTVFKRFFLEQKYLYSVNPINIRPFLSTAHSKRQYRLQKNLKVKKNCYSYFLWILYTCRYIKIWWKIYIYIYNFEISVPKFATFLELILFTVNCCHDAVKIQQQIFIWKIVNWCFFTLQKIRGFCSMKCLKNLLYFMLT